MSTIYATFAVHNANKKKKLRKRTEKKRPGRKLHKVCCKKWWSNSKITHQCKGSHLSALATSETDGQSKTRHSMWSFKLREHSKHPSWRLSPSNKQNSPKQCFKNLHRNTLPNFTILMARSIWERNNFHFIHLIYLLLCILVCLLIPTWM